MTAALVIVVLVAAFLLYVATRSAEFRVTRSTRISAPPERILPLIDDYHAWSAWSPWEKLDPTMKRTFSGAPRGVGTIYEWDGNKKAGAGRMEIVREDARRIEMSLDFIRPFRATNVTEFTLDPDGSATRLTWTMTGTNAFMSKLFGVFINMDKLIGTDFEKGLASLKAASEQNAPVSAAAT